MSEVSQLQVNGTTYDLCDAVARNDIETLDGKITNLQQSVNQFHTEAVTGTVLSDSLYAAITAPSISGYSFICWIGISSNGWIGSFYALNPTLANTSAWTSRITNLNNAPTFRQADAPFIAYALYSKNV